MNPTVQFRIDNNGHGQVLPFMPINLRYVALERSASNQMQEEAESDHKVADILSTICELNRGNFAIECGRKLQELSDAIIDTGGKGRLVITLDVTPSGLKKGRINQFEVRPEVKITKPQHDQGSSIFFVTPDGKLTRDDPDQMDLELKEFSEERRK
jgi:hypothetical protein